MIRTVLFDMDGTVLDTERIYHHCWRIAANEVGFFDDLAPILPMVSGMNYSDIGEYFYANYGKDFPYEQMMSRRAVHVAKMLEDEGRIPVKAGMVETIHKLHAMGLQIAIVTSSERDRANRFLGQSGLLPLFDWVITGEDVIHSKPAPDIYLLAAKMIGTQPDACVVVEDSRNGVLSGVAAGMRVVMIPDMQPCTADLKEKLWYCIEDSSTLPALIDLENQRLSPKE